VDADARVADVDGQCCRQMSDGGWMAAWRPYTWRVALVNVKFREMTSNFDFCYKKSEKEANLYYKERVVVARFGTQKIVVPKNLNLWSTSTTNMGQLAEHYINVANEKWHA
jgi:hypothetical protein